MSKKEMRKTTTTSENAFADDHTLIRLLIAEQTALAEEIFQLVHDVQEHMSLVSALYAAKTADAINRIWESHVHHSRCKNC